MAGRVATTQGSAARWWLAGGAFAMGLGVWSMHFVGMLAFDLPIPLGYDITVTACSMLAASAPRRSRCGWCRARSCRAYACCWGRC